MANHQIDNTVYTLRSCISENHITNLTTLEARINLSQMYNYRVLDIGTMGMFSSAQGELNRLLKDWEAYNDPNWEDFHSLLWRYASVLRSIDFADRFILVHSEPLNPSEEIAALRKRLNPRLHNRTKALM